MKINKNCADYCICVLRCLMQKKNVPPMPESLTAGELYAFSRLHGVEAMVYHALEQTELNRDEPVWPDWHRRADMLMTQSVVQLAERDMLFSLLPGAGVELLPVKGCWLKEQYPEIDWRQMCDLDMLIHHEDMKKAEALMLSLGYSKESDTAKNHDEYIKPPYMGVELHHSLLPVNDERCGYYADVWKKAVPVEDWPGVFRLKAEDEYIFQLLHLFKHTTSAGIGIRAFLDNAVFRGVSGDMDKDYLAREYDKLGISGFVRCIETLADCWFTSGEAVPAELEAMADSILSAGSYGTEERRVQSVMRRLGGKGHRPLAAKLRYLFAMLFLPLSAMRELYPVLNKAPLLLPVFWLWRPVDRLIFRPEALTNIVKQTNKAGDKLCSEFDWQQLQSK